MNTPPIGRRTVLRGLGTAVALPWLEAMGPLGQALAADPSGAKKAPLRMAFLYVPNGAHMADWTPHEEGPAYKVTPILEPLAAYKDDLLVLSGLAQDKAFAHGDGGGDHARGLATFLTGCQARKTDGANIKVGMSVDQVAASKLLDATRLPSLELGCDRGGQSGNCDSGYSCAYSSNISWRSESTPMPKEVNPRLVFDRLFAKGETGDARALRARYRRSILDLVGDDAQALRSRLGAGDARKVDEYLTAVREVERRVQAAAKPDATKAPDYKAPDGVPKYYAEHIRLLIDMMVLAFQGDVTRVSTFVYANEGSTRSYKFIGVPEGHHDVSHHAGNPEKHAKIRQINVFHVRQFAYLLGKLKSIREGQGTLLDNAMIVYGSGISDGNSHAHDNLPIVLAGRGGGIKSGRHVRMKTSTPLNNLYLSMLDRMGTPIPNLGDSTGRLGDLS